MNQYLDLIPLCYKKTDRFNELSRILGGSSAVQHYDYINVLCREDCTPPMSLWLALAVTFAVFSVPIHRAQAIVDKVRKAPLNIAGRDAIIRGELMSLPSKQVAPTFTYTKDPYEIVKCQLIKTTGENNMNRLDTYKEYTVAQVTLVNGVDASTMSEQDFFGKLRNLQAELGELKSLPESTYVTARIDEVTTDIKALTTLMDTVLQRS